jgi:hypothetical protein
MTALTRGPGRLLPSDLAPILQYGSRPPSDFIAKILGVDTSPFLWNTRFYFTCSYLQVYMSCSIVVLIAVLRNAVVNVLDSYVADPGSSPRFCFFF